VATALRRARHEAIAAGLPAAAWAGFGLQGDGALRPVRRPPARRPDVVIVGLAVMLAVAAVAGIWWMQMQRRRWPRASI
jgi:uncharacterized membrane protein YqjE